MLSQYNGRLAAIRPLWLSEPQDLRVARHVHEAVAADVEGDRLRLARLLALQGLVDRARDGVRALRGGQEALRPDELAGAGEHVLLVRRVRDRVDVAEAPEER